MLLELMIKKLAISYAYRHVAEQAYESWKSP